PRRYTLGQASLPRIILPDRGCMVPDRPGSHCEGDRLYHCEVEGGKHAEVCNDGWMVYRFGALAP
ncbi:MAG: hypothetical protein ACI9VR_001837, partial [Cognaticolwellia sp.]